MILLGIKSDDNENDLIFVCDKCSNLRIFEDENEKMNLSLKDINGEVLIISQFTLYGDAQKEIDQVLQKLRDQKLQFHFMKILFQE